MVTLAYLLCVAVSVVVLAVALRHHPAPPQPPMPPAPVAPALITEAETQLILAAAQLAARLTRAA